MPTVHTLRLPILCLGIALGLGAASTALAGGPQQDYVLYCMGCHGPAGRGVPGKVPGFAGTLTRFMRTPEGREYLLRVPGAANSPVSDGQLAGILNWAAQCFDAAPGSEPPAPFTASEVAAHRHQPLAAVSERRHALVEALRASGEDARQGY